MKNLYAVTAINAGYLSHKSYQLAESEQDAIDTVISYHMTPGTKYDTISAAIVSGE